MKHRLDLHGLTHKEAVEKTESMLIGASFDKAMEVEIVTGMSKTMQDKIIKEVIDVYNFSYYIPVYNQGIIIVSENNL